LEAVLKFSEDCSNKLCAGDVLTLVLARCLADNEFPGNVFLSLVEICNSSSCGNCHESEKKKEKKEKDDKSKKEKKKDGDESDASEASDESDDEGEKGGKKTKKEKDSVTHQLKDDVGKKNRNKKGGK
jgi:hypothetical protein